MSSNLSFLNIPSVIVCGLISIFSVDKNGVERRLKLYFKKGNLYLGGVQALFNRHYVCKDKNRIEFTSKLTRRYTELMHISVIFDKIDKHKVYSNFTKEILKEALYAKGYTDEDFTLKDKLNGNSIFKGNVSEIKKQILNIKGILDIHHIHIRSLDGYNNFATFHILALSVLFRYQERRLISHACRLRCENVNYNLQKQRISGAFVIYCRRGRHSGICAKSAAHSAHVVRIL